ncbi:MAG: type I-E CRISPR-associated protein Cas7/Cse4/CasC [Oscillospiraceae bacterium]|nr:type I-E CRISPR-associated protein Cas7/Cse4/CasC [Oscillospiraceae bacterium]
MKPKLFMDIHVIQTVPPSCLNRDDTGSPKTAVYGGARRARVSSQSWKRAMRLMFNEHLDVSELSYRTLKIFDLVADKILEKSSEYTREDALVMAKEMLKKAKVEPSKKDADKSEALFFLSDKQAENLASLALEGLDDKETTKAVVQTLKANNGVDLALFGRMVASNPDINCDASAQVAHAISTHRIENEYDYFTAVDDLSTEEHAGAGMIGTVEYNSATLYRYATVAVHELFVQLSKDSSALERALREFIRAFVLSMPSGKQNTFAAHTLPYAVMVSLRSDRPLNLVDAFEKPIKSTEGFTLPSAEEFAKHAMKSYSEFCTKPVSSYTVGEFLPELGKKLNLDELLIEAVKDTVERIMS